MCYNTESSFINYNNSFDPSSEKHSSFAMADNNNNNKSLSSTKVAAFPNACSPVKSNKSYQQTDPYTPLTPAAAFRYSEGLMNAPLHSPYPSSRGGGAFGVGILTPTPSTPGALFQSSPSRMIRLTPGNRVRKETCA